MSGKPKLKPPSQPRIFETDPSASRFKLISLTVFIVLVIVAVAVVFFLPTQVSRQRQHARVTSEAEPAQSQTQVAKDLTSKAREAQELLQKVLNLKSRLDNEGVKKWGAEPLGTSYSQVLASLTEANASLDEQRFDQAAEGYRDTIVKLEQLADSRPERVRRAIQAGDKAL